MVFFWLVPLPEGRFRREAPYADVLETLWFRGGKNSQKWQKMAKNDHKREKIFELDEKNDQFANASLILQTRLLSHKIGAL